MPVVPFDPRGLPKTLPAGSTMKPPDPNFLLMAAAQMHKEGRLVKKEPTTSGPSQK